MKSLHCKKKIRSKSFVQRIGQNKLKTQNAVILLMNNMLSAVRSNQIDTLHDRNQIDTLHDKNVKEFCDDKNTLFYFSFLKCFKLSICDVVPEIRLFLIFFSFFF